MAHLHISIIPEKNGNTYQVIQCLSNTCLQCVDKTKGLYHCQLCSLAFTIPSRLKAHYNKVHWSNKITTQGYNILRCAKQCKSVGPRKGEDSIKGAHYHYFGCANLFTRAERAVRHYATHCHIPKNDNAIALKSEAAQTAQQHNTNLHSVHTNQPAPDNSTLALPNVGPNGFGIHSRIDQENVVKD